jgi:hypothetical protein
MSKKFPAAENPIYPGQFHDIFLLKVLAKV